MSPGIRPTRAEIDLDAVVHNARRLGQVASQDGAAGNIWAVVKANAYGHGAAQVAGALWEARAVGGFAVSLVEEGLELRDAGIDAPILVMGPALDGGYEDLVARKMTAMVSDPADIEHLAAIGRRRGEPVDVHRKVDTRKGRRGVLPDAVPEILERSLQRGGFRVSGLATHLACADAEHPEDEASMTRAQIERFDRVVAAARALGLRRVAQHAANSAATFRFPEARRDWVRPGLALYGGGVGDGLRQAMRFTTHVAQIREVPAGTTVSYGAVWEAERESRLAVLPIGYADGLPRASTGRAEILIRGRRCPVVGKISMDISIADVTDLGGNVAVGDTVVLLGAQGEERISAGEFARHAGLIEYEVTCGISKRVPRVYP